MSITEAIKDMEKHMGVDEDFSRYMNKPIPHNNQGYVQNDYKTGEDFIHCPFCGKKQFPVEDEKKNHYRCKSKKCGKEYEVRIWTQEKSNQDGITVREGIRQHSE